eukprot:scaffold7808_cov184-Amphora_coffeaeformis.AAC.33
MEDNDATNDGTSNVSDADVSVSLDAAATAAATEDHDDDDSFGSTIQTHGTWRCDDDQDEDDDTEGKDDVPWRGCVCGIIHPRPLPVFWMQCDGPCQSWYNVASACVNGWTRNDAQQRHWMCPTCHKDDKDLAEYPALSSSSSSSRSWFASVACRLPGEVWFRILKYTARPTHRAAVVMQQLAPLCQAAHFALASTPRADPLWNLILREDYCLPYHAQPHQHQEKEDPLDTAPKAVQTTTITTTAETTIRRSSRRKRRLPPRCADRNVECFVPWNHSSSSSNNNNTNNKKCMHVRHPRSRVRREHLLLLQRTEDAYHAVEALANPSPPSSPSSSSSSSSSSVAPTPQRLSASRLRQVLQRYAPLDVDRPSPRTGRTMLQVVCAADVSEHVAVRCATLLLTPQQQSQMTQPHTTMHQPPPFFVPADPNTYTRSEHPWADRPALHFCVSRLMPRLIETVLYQGRGANPTAVARGKFCLTFDTTQCVQGEFTPLQLARAIQRAEITNATATHKKVVVPPYWAHKLNECIQILQTAERNTRKNN